MRSTAYKLKIEDIVQGKYMRPSEEEPAHLLTPWGQHVSRARIMGTVIEKFIRDDMNYGLLHIDDGSDVISVRAWREGTSELANFNAGELVDIVGRVREYAGEVYLVPDLMMKVDDPNWELVRELETLYVKRQALKQGVRPQIEPQQVLEARELKVELPAAPEQGATPEIEEIEGPPLPQVPEEIKKKALLAFEKLDKGSGTTQADIAAELNLPQTDAEDVLRVLIAEGEIFEPISGKFRRLR